MVAEADSTARADSSAQAAGERLEIRGLTGVAVALEIAGPGSRSYAFVIDWQFRVLLTLAWFAVAWLPARLLRDAPASGRHFALTAVLPALLIYFFYQPILELLMRGRSPGKRIAGVRLVTRSGGTPGVGALLIRNVFRIIDCLPALYVVGLVCCLLTPQRVRIGDLAAGTLLVVDDRAADSELTRLGSSLGRSALSPALIELAHDLLQRWSSLEVAHRRELACTLLARGSPAGAASDELARLPDTALRARIEQLIGEAADAGRVA